MSYERNILDLNEILYFGTKNIKQIIKKWNKEHYNSNKPGVTIAFIGDSYCAELNQSPRYEKRIDGGEWLRSQNYPAWTELVAKHFNAKILQLGLIGQSFTCSFFQSYVDLRASLSVLFEADIIIVCISAPDRLSTSLGIPLSPAVLGCSYEDVIATVNVDGVKNPEELINAARLYYSRLYTQNFHYIAQKGALRELDEFMLEKGTDKVIIWLPCFKESMCDYKPKSGAVGDLELFEVFKNDACNFRPDLPEMREKEYEWFRYKQHHSVRNHLAPKSNESLATMLINYINNKHEYQIPVRDLL